MDLFGLNLEWALNGVMEGIEMRQTFAQVNFSNLTFPESVNYLDQLKGSLGQSLAFCIHTMQLGTVDVQHA